MKLGPGQIGCAYTGSTGGAIATDTNTAADVAAETASSARASNNERTQCRNRRAFLSVMVDILQARCSVNVPGDREVDRSPQGEAVHSPLRGAPLAQRPKSSK